MANIDETKNSAGNAETPSDELLQKLSEQRKKDIVMEELKKTNPEMDVGDLKKSAEDIGNSVSFGSDTQIDMRTLSDEEFKDLFDNYLTSSDINVNIDDSDYKEIHKHIINLQQKSGAALTSETELAEAFGNTEENEIQITEETEAFKEEPVAEKQKKEPKKSIFARLKMLAHRGKKNKDEDFYEENYYTEETDTTVVPNVAEQVPENSNENNVTDISDIPEGPVFDEYSTPTEEILENHIDDTSLLSAFEPAPKEENEPESDAMMTDTAMMKAFGIDQKSGSDEEDTSEDIFDNTTYNTIDETVYGKASATEIINNKSDTEEKAAETKVSKDYSSFEQNKSIFDSYKRKYASLRIKMILCALFAIVLLFIANIGIFGVELPLFMQSSAGFAAIEWIFLFACALLVCDHMIDAAKRLAKFEFDSNSLTLVMFAMSVITSIVALFADSENIKMFNFPFAVCVLFNLLGAYICVRKEIFTFKILSSQKTKHAVTVIKNSKASPEAAEFAEYLSEGSELYKITETDFVDGYFARRNEKPKANKKLRILIPVIFGVSVIFAIISAAVSKTGAYESVANAYLAFLMCAPMSVFLATELPMYLSSVRAYSGASAIIGNVAPEMLENMSVLAFSDNDVFGNDGVKIKGVKVIANNKIENILYYVSSAFSLVGGPLAELFKQATLEGKVSDNSEIRVLSDNGIDATVDGRHIVVGTPAYMEAQCFKTIYEQGDENFEGRTSNKRILYLACDEEIIAKFYVEYRISADFVYLVKRLSASGICISVRTNDPCLDADVLCRGKFSPEKYPIRMIKGEKADAPENHVEATETGVVSIGSVKNLVKTVLLCDRINSISRTNFVIKAVSAFIGAIVMGFLLFSGAYTNVWSLYPALYQAFWMLPIYLISKIYI